MFAIIEEHYSEIILKNNTCLVSSIKIDALMNSAHNSLNYVDMTVEKTFISSEILSLRLCKAVERA
jgi:hypothetical protein